MSRFFLFVFGFCFLAACDGGRRERLQLEELERQNRADSLMTNDSLALALTNYFDRHGTPNEQLRAYYILGRTYADVGEAPRAIEAYNTAADRADTTAADCDYKTLSRVFAQMSDVYYCQGLYREELNSNQCAIRYGFLAADTLAVLLTYAQQMDTYKRLMKPDSMLYVCETVTDRFRQVGYSSLAARLLCPPVQYLIDQHNYIKARHFLEVYECESGFFDENHNIMPGREVYYFTKGYYYLKTCQYDSAEYFFRKELATGKDLNNQNAGSYGLALLFQQTHKPDSAAKYALYSYAMNDSVYDEEATTEVARMKSLYDYTRYEHEAQKEKQRADHERRKAIMVVVIALLVVFIGVYIFWLQRKHHRATYRRAVKKLGEAQNTILRLRSHEAVLNSTIKRYSEKQDETEVLKSELANLKSSIKDYEEEIERQKSIVEAFQRKQMLTKETIDQKINQSEIYKHLRTIANQGKHMTDEDWSNLMQLVISLLPGFYRLISSKERVLSRLEYQICVLERLGIEPRRMHYLLGCSESYVSIIRGGLHKKIFDSEASRKDFSSALSTIF